MGQDYWHKLADTVTYSTNQLINGHNEASGRDCRNDRCSCVSGSADAIEIRWIKGDNMTKFRTTISSFFLICLSAAAAGDNVQQQLLHKVDEIRASAEAADAALLSPKSYAAAVKDYDRAIRDLGNNNKSERATKRLNKAEAAFRHALENAELARINLRKPIQSRDNANNAEAFRLAPQNWIKAEGIFNNATLALEKGKLKTAQLKGDESDIAYQLAELNAIKSLHLSEARSLIATAEQAKTEKFAPLSVQRSREYLARAEQALDLNRYETEEPISLAEKASYEARHAMYIAGVVQQVRKKNISVEQLILAWESPLTAAGEAADIDVDLSEGHEIAGSQLVDEVEDLKHTNTLMKNEITERDRLVLGLEEELRDLDAKLGGASAERAALVKTLEDQARTREQFAQVGALFSPKEAIILRDKDKLIVRLVGLNFSSGSADLTSDAKKLMETVEDAVNVFPMCEVVVEGHTDSYGSANKNLILSKNRAQSVVNFMLSDMNIPPHRVTATGFGDTHPIANNKTAAGRAKNRRIDLIIIP